MLLKFTLEYWHRNYSVSLCLRMSRRRPPCCLIRNLSQIELYFNIIKGLPLHIILCRNRYYYALYGFVIGRKINCINNASFVFISYGFPCPAAVFVEIDFLCSCFPSTSAWITQGLLFPRADRVISCFPVYLNTQ